MSPVRPSTAVLRAVARAPGRPDPRQAALIAGVAAAAPLVLPGHGLDTPRRLAHFLAQIAHESDGFRATEEYASGAAYEGRRDLGNTRPGDGRRYKGRGLLMLTGRANYRLYGRLTGQPLEAAPARAAAPALSLEIAALYWTRRGLNRRADRDDLRAITRAINGGVNGLSDRRERLGRARVALAQQRLADLGLDPGPVDGLWGARTTAGLGAFRAAAGLPATRDRAEALARLWETAP